VIATNLIEPIDSRFWSIFRLLFNFHARAKTFASICSARDVSMVPGKGGGPEKREKENA